MQESVTKTSVPRANLKFIFFVSEWRRRKTVSFPESNLTANHVGRKKSLDGIYIYILVQFTLEGTHPKTGLS